MNRLPQEVNGLIQQYPDVHPTIKTCFDAVLKQMRRRKVFKRRRRNLDFYHIARWEDPRIQYFYLDTDERRLYAELSYEHLIQEILNNPIF